jgi:hypothetical protein
MKKNLFYFVGIDEEIADDILKPEDIKNFSVFTAEEITENTFNYFREIGFKPKKIPLHICKQEINRLNKNNNINTLQRTTSCYDVADSYHPQRMEVRCNNHFSPKEGFFIDKKLYKAIQKDILFGKIIRENIPGFLNIVSGVQSASNFRPGYACYIYRKYCRKNDTVLDTSMGFGGRLVGFIASGINGKYIGIDPAKKTYEGNILLYQELGKNIETTLINKPCEDVLLTEIGNVDLCFTSPPYYNREIYSDEDTQSCNRYTTPESWRDNFLKKMIELQYSSLNNNKYNIININDIKINKKIIPLVAWTKEISENTGFEYICTEKYQLNSRVGDGNNGDVAFEPVLVFKKCE